jgi:hypothetical protein
MTENTKDRFEGINRSSRTTETREKRRNAVHGLLHQHLMLLLHPKGTNIGGFEQKFAVLMTVKYFFSFA